MVGVVEAIAGCSAGDSLRGCGAVVRDLTASRQSVFRGPSVFPVTQRCVGTGWVSELVIATDVLSSEIERSLD